MWLAGRMGNSSVRRPRGSRAGAGWAGGPDGADVSFEDHQFQVFVSFDLAQALV